MKSLSIIASVLYITSVNGVTDCLLKRDCKNKVVADDQINCQASYMCQGSTLTASDTISCSSSYACYRAISLTATNDIICDQQQSCYKTTNIRSTNGDVYCNNALSCDVSTINAQNIYCLSTSGSQRPCQKANLNAVNDITLGAKYASYQTDVVAGGDIYVTSNLGAYYGRLTGTNIYIQAAYGAHQASRLKARNSVHCIGERACAHGKGIIPLGNSLYVEFNGLYAGGDISVVCPSAGDCTIVCANQGCVQNSIIDTVIIYTPGGTSLTIDPPECGPKRQNRPDTCPVFRKKRAAEVAEMIVAIDTEEFPSDEEIVEDDFMAYVGVELHETETYGLGSYSYTAIGLSIIVISVMVIGAYIYYKGRNKYEIIQ